MQQINKILRMVRRRYEKILDPVSQLFFSFNLKAQPFPVQLYPSLPGPTVILEPGIDAPLCSSPLAGFFPQLAERCGIVSPQLASRLEIYDSFVCHRATGLFA